MKYIGLFIKKLLRYLLKPLSFLPAIVVMYLIFSFSSQDGVSSARLSRMVSEKVVVTADQVLEKGWSAEQIAAYTEQIHYYVRKTAHVTEYFVLAVTVAFPLYVYGIRGLWLVLLAGVFCVSFAGLDEYHQSFVAGLLHGMWRWTALAYCPAFCWFVLWDLSGEKPYSGHWHSIRNNKADTKEDTCKKKIYGYGM